MKTFFTAASKIGVFVLLSWLALAPNAEARTRHNDQQIVLVHGFMGWGRDELLGYKYWGGLFDLERFLRDSGYGTHTVAVGPFSSNWDRACELYAQIKGGRVDYGEAHSRAHGHARFGRTYAAKWPQWGTLDSAGKLQKIHLLAHSQGGQTSRQLTQLLRYGDAAEKQAAQAGGYTVHPLFAGNKNWVSSITTIATPHDGTTLAEGGDMIPLIRQFLATVSAMAGVTGGDHLYDFKLDHWGLTKKSGERLDDYLTRMFNHPLWRTRDISAYDLKPEGAAVLNGKARAQSDVYYFSWETEATYDLFGVQAPEITMLAPFHPGAWFMGSYTRNGALDSSWFKNDGVVNTRSMKGPTLNSTDAIINFTGTQQPGKWQRMGLKKSWDHADIIGHTFWPINDFYRDYADLVASLPN